MDIGDDNSQLHGAAAVPSVGRHDLLVDPGSLKGCAQETTKDNLTKCGTSWR